MYMHMENHVLSELARGNNTQHNTCTANKNINKHNDLESHVHILMQ